MRLDHVFVVARARADTDEPSRSDDALARSSRRTADRWAESLLSAGLAEGSNRRHRGQGTANRCFFFERFMLEILYIDDAHALRGPVAGQLQLLQRFTDTGASPFGLGFRPDRAGDPADFDACAFRPGYLPPHWHIDLFQANRAQDPLLFHLPFIDPAAHSPSSEHRCGARTLRSIELHCRQAPEAAYRQVLQRAGIDVLADGDSQLTLRLASAANPSKSADAVSTPVTPLKLADDLPVNASVDENVSANVNASVGRRPIVEPNRPRDGEA